MSKNKAPNKLTREGSFKVSEDSSEIELSFSSEEPYLRSFGNEILSHADGVVDLSRLNEIGVVLFNHDPEKVIGRIDRAWIENGRGKALIKFDDDEESQRICEKVRSGTLKGVSVGYNVTEWDYVEGKGDKPDTWTATKWMPFEISIVSIPADASVGVGRSMEKEQETVTESVKTEEETEISQKADKIKTTNSKENSQMEKENKVETPLNEERSLKQDTPHIDERAIVEGERNRINEINSMCRDFEVDADNFIKNGSTVEQVRAAIMADLKARKAPATVTVKEDEGDKFRSAAIDALVMRSGTNLKEPAKGSNELRGFSLRDLAIESLAVDANGTRSRDSLRRMSPDDLYSELQRAYFNPSAAFPAILDATIKKNIVEIYDKVPTTFQTWTSKGSVSDFKVTPDHNYLIGGGNFEKVPENGELKASKPSTELLPNRKIDTYGTSFSMSRQAFINDDIGFLAHVPALYAGAAKRKINQQVYEMLFNNSTIYDNKALFHADHKNLVATGAAPSMATINALMMKMQTQKDPFDQAINVVPQLLILPVGYGLDVDVILHSTSITTTASNNTGYNPMANKGLSYIEEPLLNQLSGTGACPWFLVANAMSAKSIQVDYLNGVEAPTVRRSEKPGQLGFSWDIFLDWGISVIDFRGIAKNAGVKVTI